MKLLLVFLLLVPSLLCAQIGESVNFLDNFNRTTDSLSQSGSPHTNWVRLANQTPVTGDIRADGAYGTAQSGMANGEAGIVVYDSLVTSDSLALRFIWVSPSNAPGTAWGYNDISTYIRMNTTDKATWDGWGVAIGGWYTASSPNRVNIYINRIVNGVETNYASSPQFVLNNNDTVRVWNIKDTIKVYQNQTLQVAYYHATYAPVTGYVGLGARKYTTSAKIDNFSIGKAGAVSVPPPASDLVAPAIVYASQEPFGLKPNDSLSYRVDATDAFAIKKIVWTSNGSPFDSVTKSTPMPQSTSFTSKKRVFSSVGTYTWGVSVEDSAGNISTQAGQHSVDTVAAIHRDSTKKIIAYVATWGLDLTAVGGPSGGNYRMPLDSLDFDAIDYFVMFHAYVDLATNSIRGLSGLSATGMKPVNDWIHTNRPGKAVMVSFGGAGGTTMTPFLQNDATINQAVNICLKWIDSVKYDGFDFDPEPPPSAALKTNMTTFFQRLRDSLNTRTPLYNPTKQHVLTAAIDRSTNNHSLWSDAAQYLDFINIMTYDFYWGDWQKTWHNNAAYASGSDLTPWNTSNYSVAERATVIRPTIGIAKSKLGVGIDFNGYLFNGNVTRLTGYNGAPVSPADGVWSARHYYGSTVLSQITNIGTASGAPGKGGSQEYWRMRRYILDTLSPGNLKFDPVAKAAYIELNGPGSTTDRFGSIPDTANHSAIVQLVIDSGYGAIIVWNIDAAYLNKGAYPTGSLPVGTERDFLLQNIKEKFYGTGATPPPPTPPVAPSLVSPAAGATGINNEQVPFVWRTVSNATKYRIRVSEFSNFSAAVVNDSTTDTTYQFLSTGSAGPILPLKQNTLYYWGVGAINADGQGPDSIRTFTTLTFTINPPGAPTLSAPPNDTTNMPVTVTFTWLPGVGDTVTGYHFQLARDAGFATIDLNDSAASTPRIVSFLQKGVKYYWRVRSKNAAGWGSYSATRNFTVAAAPAVPDVKVNLLWRDSKGRTRTDPPPWLPIAVTPDSTVAAGITADPSYGAISSGGYTGSGGTIPFGGYGGVPPHSHDAADITSGVVGLPRGGLQSSVLGNADPGRPAKKRYIVQNTPQTAPVLDTIKESDLPAGFGADGVGTILTDALPDTARAMVVFPNGVSIRFDSSTIVLRYAGADVGVISTVAGGLTITGPSAASGFIDIRSNHDNSGLRIRGTDGMDVNQGTSGERMFRMRTVTSTDDPGIEYWAQRGTTTDATPTMIYQLALDSAYANSTTFQDTATYIVTTTIKGSWTGGAAGALTDGCVYKFTQAFRTATSTTAQIGSTTTVLAAETQGGFDASVAISGKYIQATVTGITNYNMTWDVIYEISFLNN